jgi:uncharacterized membrane protein YeaQ/YmgE (transglycosylase-associated protein family)
VFAGKRARKNVMNILIWLVVGGLIGWVASMIMGTDGRQGVMLNVVVGIVGALIGGWLFGGVFGTSTINEGNLSISGLLVALVGAIVLIAVVKLFRGSALR